MKIFAFALALSIFSVGVLGFLQPAGLVWIAEHSITPGAFYAVATIRVAFGLVLLSVAADSRAPSALRILGYLILVAGITTALAGLLAIEHARTLIEWWLQQGSGVIRLTGLLVSALGGFVAYACAPARFPNKGQS